MIVTEKEARRIYGGRKTEHRIPRRRVAPARHAAVSVQYRQANPNLGYIDGEPMVETVTLCRATITDVAEGLLADADDGAAQREGCRSVDELLGIWAASHGPASPGERVWVLTLELDREQRPRFLSSGVIAGLRGDYTTSGHASVDYEEVVLPGGRRKRVPVEAVDEFTLDRFARDARDRHRDALAMAGSAIAQLEPHQQTRQLAELARRRAIDVRDELRQVRRYGHRPDVVDHQLAQIRARLGMVA